MTRNQILKAERLIKLSEDLMDYAQSPGASQEYQQEAMDERGMSNEELYQLLAGGADEAGGDLGFLDAGSPEMTRGQPGAQQGGQLDGQLGAQQGYEGMEGMGGSPMDMHGLGMGDQAYSIYDMLSALYPGMKFGSANKPKEEIDSIINEVVKIGRAGYVINKMMSNESDSVKKTAQELDLVNKDYLASTLSELVC